MVSKEQEAKEKRITDGVKEILAFRGYKVTKVEQLEDYIDFYGDKIEDEETVTVLVRFFKNPQIGVKVIRELGKLQKEKNINTTILVVESALTHYAKKEAIKLGIEIISSTNPLFNIFSHELVPKHEIMTPEEIEEFLTKYKIKKHQIPKILETDPAVKTIQAKPGDIIRIIRNPELGEDGYYYRYVIKSASRLKLTETSTKPKRSRSKRVKKEEIEEDEEPEEVVEEEELVEEEEIFNL